MTSGRSDLVDVELELRFETGDAFKVSDGTIVCWLPKSQCERDGNVFTMPEWLAAEKGLV